MCSLNVYWLCNEPILYAIVEYQGQCDVQNCKYRTWKNWCNPTDLCPPNSCLPTASNILQYNLTLVKLESVDKYSKNDVRAGD
jgi:hypothetical protein